MSDDLTKDAVQNTKFWFSAQYIEHYRIITRAVSVDYYKTITLAYAGGLIALATIMLSLKDSRGSASAVTKLLSFSVVIVVLIGMIFAFVGYLFTYLNAKHRRDNLVKQLQDSIFDNHPIEVPNPVGIDNSETLFRYAGGVSAVCFLVSIVLEAILVFTLL